jgi:hypothetical protein
MRTEKGQYLFFPKAEAIRKGTYQEANKSKARMTKIMGYPWRDGERWGEGRKGEFIKKRPRKSLGDGLWAAEAFKNEFRAEIR